MDPELKHLVQETLALAKENHHLLRAVRRHQIWETFGKWILWIILLAASLYSFQKYAQPLMNAFLSGASGADPAMFSTSADLQKLIDSLKAGK